MDYKDAKNYINSLLNELNIKIDKLELEKKLKDSKTIDISIDYMNKSKHYLNELIDNIKEDDNINEVIIDIKNKANNILTDLKTNISQNPDINKLLASQQFNDLKNKIENTDYKEKINSTIEFINDTTDDLLYKCRDIYDNISESDKFKDTIKSIKEISNDIKDTIIEEINKKK